ncbi:MAG: glycoside hydrolase family 5 protein [Treponema sp.]|jgi:endoglucanase|nr:glycoside hydrolase family 5 protein [Treponema sp.]
MEYFFKFFGRKSRRFLVAVLVILTGFSVLTCDSQEIVFEVPSEPRPFAELSATELVANIKIGWNLGNTLDASGSETSWGNPVTTKANITAIKNAGFNAIRIPVTWSKATNSKYAIKDSWMARVVQVVNYAVDNDMYIILNTHHDEKIFKFTNANTEKSLKAFEKIWKQIAGTFKNYDEKLIFEGLNEPRTKDSSNEWSGGTVEEHNNLKRHYQIFVDTVRASGGNNDKRILMVNTYAASGEVAAINGLVIPNDISGSGKIIASIHSYAPFNFALNANPVGTKNSVDTWSKSESLDTSAIRDPIDLVYNKFVANSIPVIIGEFGALSKNNDATRAEWAEYYVNYAMSKGIPCFWWDNGILSGNGDIFAIFNRRTNTVSSLQIVNALMRGLADWTAP